MLPPNVYLHVPKKRNAYQMGLLTNSYLFKLGASSMYTYKGYLSFSL